MKMKFYIPSNSLFIFALLLTISSCQKPTKAKAIKVVPTLVETTVSSLSSGLVEAKMQSDLAFGVIGRIDKINAKIGEKVSKGQILATLENADLAAALNEASNEFERVKELIKEGLLSTSQYEAAYKNYEASKSQFEKSIIRAPFDGIITEINLNKGSLYEARPGIKSTIHLIDQNKRIVKAEIDEIDLRKVKIGQTARIRIPAVREAPFIAKVISTVPFISKNKEQDKSSQVQFELVENDQSIPVGASADVEIIVESKNNAIAIPTYMIQGASGEKFVFKWTKKKIQMIPVKLGIGNYDRTEVLGGPQHGDIIVSSDDKNILQNASNLKLEFLSWP